MEHAFLGFEVQVVVSRHYQYVGDRGNVCVVRLAFVFDHGCDRDVVHVDADDRTQSGVFGDDGAADIVSKILKRRWGITQAEVHDRWFVRTPSGLECGLILVAFFHANVVVSLSDVQFGI